MRKFLIFIILFTSVFSFYPQIADDEIKVDDRGVRFIDYSGEYRYTEPRSEIIRIGKQLADGLKNSESNSFRYYEKYSVMYTGNRENDGKYNAVIFSIDEDAKIDSIRNIRTILSSFLSAYYNYSSKDANLLSYYITVYNNVYRGNIEYLSARYKPVVIGNLNKRNAGISNVYSEWVGQTKILIPLTREGIMQLPEVMELGDKKVSDAASRSSSSGEQLRTEREQSGSIPVQTRMEDNTRNVTESKSIPAAASSASSETVHRADDAGSEYSIKDKEIKNDKTGVSKENITGSSTAVQAAEEKLTVSDNPVLRELADIKRRDIQRVEDVIEELGAAEGLTDEIMKELELARKEVEEQKEKLSVFEKGEDFIKPDVSGTSRNWGDFRKYFLFLLVIPFVLLILIILLILKRKPKPESGGSSPARRYYSAEDLGVTAPVNYSSSEPVSGKTVVRKENQDIVSNNQSADKSEKKANEDTAVLKDDKAYNKTEADDIADYKKSSTERKEEVDEGESDELEPDSQAVSSDEKEDDNEKTPPEQIVRGRYRIKKDMQALERVSKFNLIYNKNASFIDEEEHTGEQVVIESKLSVAEIGEDYLIATGGIGLLLDEIVDMKGIKLRVDNADFMRNESNYRYRLVITDVLKQSLDSIFTVKDSVIGEKRMVIFGQDSAVIDKLVGKTANSHSIRPNSGWNDCNVGGGRDVNSFMTYDPVFIDTVIELSVNGQTSDYFIKKVRYSGSSVNAAKRPLYEVFIDKV